MRAGLPERLGSGGTRVLVATSVGGHPLAPLVDGLVGSALWLRGAEPTILLCDGQLPACEQCAFVAFDDLSSFVEHGPQTRLCNQCAHRGSTHLAPLPLNVTRYSQFMERGVVRAALDETRLLTLHECLTFEREGLRLGEQTNASLLRFYGKADLSSEPEDQVLASGRRFAAGAIVAAHVGQRVIDALEPDVITAHHGVYVPQGVLGEVARRSGVRVVNWGSAYRDRSFIFSHGDTYHSTFLTESTDAWRNRPLSASEEERLMAFLAARRRGEGDWAWITPESGTRLATVARTEIETTLGLDPNRPVVGLLTNVLWDAQLYYEGLAFADMLEWLWFTIDHFARSGGQLVVRIHPHEVKSGNRQPVGPAIATRYPSLPPNVKIVDRDEPFNTYELMDMCRSVLIYGTKTGVELAPFGIPVIVAADAWIRGKGLTTDIVSKDQYADVLARAPHAERLDAETITLARRYAYYYFFRRMIPFSSLRPATAEPALSISSLADLAVGRDPGLDVVCDGIAQEREFLFDV